MRTLLEKCYIVLVQAWEGVPVCLWFEVDIFPDNLALSPLAWSWRQAGSISEIGITMAPGYYTISLLSCLSFNFERTWPSLKIPVGLHRLPWLPNSNVIYWLYSEFLCCEVNDKVNEFQNNHINTYLKGKRQGYLKSYITSNNMPKGKISLENRNKRGNC